MRSSAQPKYACGVFGSKESVYNRYLTVVNKFVKNHARFGLKCYNPKLEGFAASLEEEQHLGAQVFIEFLHIAINQGQISGVKQHCGAAVVKLCQNTGFLAGCRRG